MNPKLKFKIDYKKDIKTFFIFVEETNFDNGRILEWAILRKYPQFEKFKKDDNLVVDKKTIEKFVKSIYSKNKVVILTNLVKYRKKWSKIEKKYFALVKDLFKPDKWPKGRYIAYPTIWGVFPRFLKDKTFQIPYKYKKVGYVYVIIAHEMLHFMFYDYFNKKYSIYKTNKYRFFVWNISEIFNGVIQNHPQWLKIFKIKTLIYPEHKKIIKKLQKVYYGRENIIVDDLIKDIIKALK